MDKTSNCAAHGRNRSAHEKCEQCAIARMHPSDTPMDDHARAPESAPALKRPTFMMFSLSSNSTAPRLSMGVGASLSLRWDGLNQRSATGMLSVCSARGSQTALGSTRSGDDATRGTGAFPRKRVKIRVP